MLLKRKPQILIFDDATSSVDTGDRGCHAQRLFWSRMRRARHWSSPIASRSVMSAFIRYSCSTKAHRPAVPIANWLPKKVSIATYDLQARIEDELQRDLADAAVAAGKANGRNVNGRIQMARNYPPENCPSHKTERILSSGAILRRRRIYNPTYRQNTAPPHVEARHEALRSWSVPDLHFRQYLSPIHTSPYLSKADYR